MRRLLASRITHFWRPLRWLSSSSHALVHQWLLFDPVVLQLSRWGLLAGSLKNGCFMCLLTQLSSALKSSHRDTQHVSYALIQINKSWDLAHWTIVIISTAHTHRHTLLITLTSRVVGDIFHNTWHPNFKKIRFWLHTLESDKPYFFRLCH